MSNPLEEAAQAVLEAIDKFGHVSDCSPPVKALRALVGGEEKPPPPDEFKLFLEGRGGGS